MTRADARNRRGAVGILLAATAVAWILTASGSDGWIPFSAWVISMAAACVAVPGGRKAPGFSRSDWVALVFVTVLAAFFRLYQLDTIPNGLWIDEIWTSQNAVTLSRRGAFVPFDTTLLSPLERGGDRQCNLYLYFAWLVQEAFGSGRLGIKMISVLPGILAVPALFLLARSFLNRTASLAAAGLFAVSIWHVTLSRWGWAEVLATALFVVVFFFLHRGIRTGSHRSLVVAGIVSGLSLYTYLAARLGVAAVLVFLCLHLLEKPGRLRARSLALYVLGLCVAGFPVFMIWFRDLDFFWGRMSSVSILSAVLAGNIDGLIHNIVSHLLMFHWSGDMNPRHNLPGEPMLDPLSGIFFLAGIVVAFRSIRKTESQLCLLWLFFGLLGGILSNPAEAPQGYRTGIVSPACFLLAGLALETCDSHLSKKTPVARRIFTLAVILLLSASASVNFAKYFVDRPASRPAWYSSMGGVAEFITDRVANEINGGHDVYIDAAYRDFILEFDLDMLFRGDPTGETEKRTHWIDVREETTDFSFFYDPTKKIAIFVMPRNFGGLRARLPDSRPEWLENRFGDTLSVLITRSP